MPLLELRIERPAVPERPEDPRDRPELLDRPELPEPKRPENDDRPERPEPKVPDDVDRPEPDPEDELRDDREREYPPLRYRFRRP